MADKEVVIETESDFWNILEEIKPDLLPELMDLIASWDIGTDLKMDQESSTDFDPLFFFKT